ncbi:MAG: zeta toxin family protein [Candidatus Omnitrophica bacterium]|nr:zeta toxin family protein [Candidatus Omnitrophota bacterium]
MRNRNVYIIAGPNGSGKTTFATKFLQDYVKCSNFVNADLIAHGLSPFSPRTAAIKAGKLVISQIHEFANAGVDFAFESTLAGKSNVNLFKELKIKEYKLHIFFLWIPNADLAITRIKDRVKEGGHNVASQDVRRRFKRSIDNFFKLYQPLIDSWMFFNNAGAVPVLIGKGRNGQISIVNEELFKRINGLER